MFKFDKVKRLFDCDLCSKLLVDPITISCGNTICQTHVNEMLETRFKAKNTFICQICEDEHVVPETGFLVNKRLKCALDIKLNEFKIGNEAFDECKTTLEEADKSFADLESFANNSEVHIYDYFEEVKRQVDLRRETLKQK
jgi:hypothetical protein